MLPNYSSQTKVNKWEFPNKNFKPNLPNQFFQAIVHKPTVPNQSPQTKGFNATSQTQSPRPKTPDHKFHSKDPKAKIPNRSFRTKDPKHMIDQHDPKPKIPNTSSRRRFPNQRSLTEDDRDKSFWWMPNRRSRTKFNNAQVSKSEFTKSLVRVMLA